MNRRSPIATACSRKRRRSSPAAACASFPCATFPISSTMTGALFVIKPGGMRELHWHANAAEWAYVIDGRCRVTTIDPENQAEIVDFGPGDVW